MKLNGNHTKRRIKNSRKKNSMKKNSRKKNSRNNNKRIRRRSIRKCKNGGSSLSGSKSSGLVNSSSSWVDVAEECYPTQNGIDLLTQKEDDDTDDLFTSACEFFEPEPQMESPSCERIITDKEARDIEKGNIIDQLAEKGYVKEASIIKGRQNDDDYTLIMMKYGSKILEKASSFVSGAVSHIAEKIGISMEDIINISKYIKVQTLYIYIDNYTRGSVTGMMRGTEAKARVFASAIFEISQRFASHENAERAKKAHAGLNFMEYINDWRADIGTWGYIQNYFLQAIGEVMANGMRATPQAIRNWNSLCTLLKDCENINEGLGGLAPNQRVVDAAEEGMRAAAGMLGIRGRGIQVLEQ